jgi:glycolate oxidase FAD binding subunit
MTDRILGKLKEAFAGLALERDAGGVPRLAPEQVDDVAAVLALATEEGWKVRVEGQATWCPPDAPADLAVTTAALAAVTSVSPGDLVATVQAGATMAAVAGRLGTDGAWLAWDPPGHPERSIGGIIATGTAGPLRHRFGPIKDHLLGCTLVTGDGRVVRPGGTVVKNVAGYDLTRFMAGGFGAFGIITDVNLRLRAVPEADRTLLTHGPRDVLTRAGRQLVESVVDAAAMELFSPALGANPEWTLAVRLVGTTDGVEAEATRIGRLTEVGWQARTPDLARGFWSGTAQAAIAGTVTIRLGVLLEGLDDTMDLVASHLGAGLLSAGAGSGSLRWTGEASLEQLQALRHALAGREIPVTLERAPWELRRAFGHFGLYREGVGALVGRLRDTFDPGKVLQVSLDAVPDA